MSWIQQWVMASQRISEWDFNVNAVDLNWSNEIMINSSYNTFWLTNNISIWVWFKTPTPWNLSAFFDLDSNISPNTNNICVWLSWWKMYFFVKNPDSKQKQYLWATSILANTKYYALVTWDWTNLKCFLNWVEDTPYSKTTDWLPDPFTDVARQVFIWSFRDSIPRNNIIISHIAVWNTALSSTEWIALYDSWNWYKLDVRNSKWNYVSTANLKHQWCPWKDWTSITTMWQDYISSWWINIWTNATNVDATDIVTF